MQATRHGLDRNPIMFDDLPLFRSTDPATSRQGAKDVLPRRDSQQGQLLRVYGENRIYGLTDEQAGNLSGLAQKPKCCYWKRCSELRQKGLIEDTGQEALSSAGSSMMVCRLTEKGARLLAGWA
jgi:hypothetical protein